MSFTVLRWNFGRTSWGLCALFYICRMIKIHRRDFRKWFLSCEHWNLSYQTPAVISKQLRNSKDFPYSTPLFLFSIICNKLRTVILLFLTENVVCIFVANLNNYSRIIFQKPCVGHKTLLAYSGFLHFVAKSSAEEVSFRQMVFCFPALGFTIGFAGYIACE